MAPATVPSPAHAEVVVPEGASERRTEAGVQLYFASASAHWLSWFSIHPAGGFPGAYWHPACTSDRMIKSLWPVREMPRYILRFCSLCIFST